MGQRKPNSKTLTFLFFVNFFKQFYLLQYTILQQIELLKKLAFFMDYWCAILKRIKLFFLFRKGSKMGLHSQKSHIWHVHVSSNFDPFFVHELIALRVSLVLFRLKFLYLLRFPRKKSAIFRALNLKMLIFISYIGVNTENELFFMEIN